MIRPPKPEPLPCDCGGDGQVRWRSDRGRWMRSSVCGVCHHERYGEAKNAARRKGTPHARKCVTALQAARQQPSPLISVFRAAVRGA